MAQRATVTAPAVRIEEHAWSRRAQDRLATYALTTPALVLLLVFFLFPIYFVVRYSVGLERFAVNEAAAELTGELAGFSTELWRDFLGPGVDLEVLRHGVGARARLGRRRRLRGLRRRRRLRTAAVGSLRRLDPGRVVPAPPGAVPDHPRGQQPAPRRRALVRRRFPAALLPLGDDGDDVGGLGRGHRVPDRLLPRLRDQEVEVHLALDRHRAVPDQLPAADLRVEDHPRRPGAVQQRALRARSARPRQPASPS